jgi:hypothetical protein
MSDDNHRTSIPAEELHQARGGGGGKGCLTRHHSRDNGHHCSHQWMALLRAQAEDRGLYNYPAYESLTTPGGEFTSGSYISRRKNLFPPGYAQKQPHPIPYAWDVGGTCVTPGAPPGINFEHYLRPYWHNAHHLIPNRTLSTAIEEAAAGDPRVTELIRTGLLMGEYNLNDKVNMMILPMGAAVADALGLPRHINGDQGGKTEFYNHPDYNARVKSMLAPVMARYKALVKEREPCKEKPPEKLAKDSLISISDRIHSAIKTLRRRVRRKRAVGKNNSLDSFFGT